MSAARGVVDVAMREKAMRIAEILVQKAFETRPSNVERHMDRTELSAYLVLAFEYGAKWESQR